VDRALIEAELEVLRNELEQFRQEKERIRDVIGQIGGQIDRSKERLINIVFLALVGALFVLDVIVHMAGWSIPGLSPAFLLSVAVLLVSAKIIWMIHRQAKIDHFQFWILNSIDFQINMISRRLGALETKVDDAAQSPTGERAPAVRT